MKMDKEVFYKFDLESVPDLSKLVDDAKFWGYFVELLVKDDLTVERLNEIFNETDNEIIRKLILSLELCPDHLKMMDNL